MYKLTIILGVCALLALCICGGAFAEDLNPPPWRGSDGTTWAMWEFSTNDTSPAPDAGCNPYGTPCMTVEPEPNQTWLAEWGGRDGVWPLSGSITVTIPNSCEPNPFKDVWVQLTWTAEELGTRPYVEETATEPTHAVPGELIDQVQLGPSVGDMCWYHSTYLIHLEPNPPCETIHIYGDILVDELVIDTICYVPEPGSLAAFASGLVGLVGFAIRRRR